MNSRIKLKKFLKGKTCCVLAPGKSLEILSKNIAQYKDLDVVWIGMNYCDYIETQILSKIGKKFDMIADCTTVAIPTEYEPERLRRFKEFLARPNNMLFISDLVVKECFKDQKADAIYKQYEDKIATIDSVFTNETYPKSVWDKPPNSITLLFAALIAGHAKKVILFGYDGKFHGNYNAITTYYGHDILREHRKKAYGRDYDIGSLTSDSRKFDAQWTGMFGMYKTIFKNPTIEFRNCNMKSVFNSIPRIDYYQVKGEVNG